MDLHRITPLKLLDYAVSADGKENRDSLEKFVAAADGKVRGRSLGGTGAGRSPESESSVAARPPVSSSPAVAPIASVWQRGSEWELRAMSLQFRAWPGPFRDDPNRLPFPTRQENWIEQS